MMLNWLLNFTGWLSFSAPLMWTLWHVKRRLLFKATNLDACRSTNECRYHSSLSFYTEMKNLVLVDNTEPAPTDS